MERTVASKNRAKAGRAGVKKRELEKSLPKEKVETLCKRLHSLGVFGSMMKIGHKMKRTTKLEK